MVYDAEVASLAEALEKAEKASETSKQAPNLEAVLLFAKAEADHPAVAEVWRNVDAKNLAVDSFFPSQRLASLVLESTLQPEAVGHALVLACSGGHIRCVKQLRELQSEQLCGSVLVSVSNAFGLLKAAEAGHANIVEEILQPTVSASTALMAYMLVTRWKDSEGTAAYPFIELPSNPPSQDWMRKLGSSKSALPPGGPIFQAGGWDLRGLPGVHGNLHGLVRASYQTYLLWRVAVVAASQCHVDVFRVLLDRRSMENEGLSKSMGAMEVKSHGKKGSSGVDVEARKLVEDRMKMDTFLYQLVEEYCTKNFHDAMLYTLWTHIQRGPSGLGAGQPRCVAQAQNGIWEIQLEVPLLMMPVEYALKDEEPSRRYKELVLLHNQRAKVNIQLIATVEAQPTFLQVTVAVKHVRFKAENSKWDETHMGHFPTVVSLSVMPQAKDGSSVTMTNSSSNTMYKIGKAENLTLGSGAGEGTSRGVGAALRASVGVSLTSTMKATPWRFEQLPLKDDRGGSFVWTLQSMKGVLFERSNPHRMANSTSHWRWGRRVPGNPLEQLPFSSEGGINFTGSDFPDTMMWRFPKAMEGKRLRWSVEGQIHSTFTTRRYFETRVANFCGDIEEKLTPMEDKKDKDKGGEKAGKNEKDGEKAEKKEKKDKDKDKSKDKDGEKSEKKEKKQHEDGGNSEKADKGENKLQHLDSALRTEFEEFLEFKREYRERQSKAKSGGGDPPADTASSIDMKPSISADTVNDERADSDGTREEQRGMKKKAMNLNLDLDDPQGSRGADRLAPQGSPGYNGRWLGSSEMEPLSPPVKSLDSIGEDIDFYKVRESASSRSASRGSIRDGEQRIKGLSVRSVRSSRTE